MRFILAILFLGLCGTCLAQPQAAAPDPYASYSGDPLPWPGGARKQLTLRRVDALLDGQRVQHFEIGGGPTIVINDLGPFRLSQAGENASLVLQDTHVPSAWLFFTVFRKGQFLPQVDEDALMRYAKALVLGAAKNESIAIIDEPGSEIPRKQVFLGAKPLFVTWERANSETAQTLRRTDYFFESGDSLLVLSVVAEPASHAAARQAAEDLMRAAYLQE